MPVKLIHESAATLDDTLLTPDGELTLEAQAISDFLTHADFSAVFDHPEAAKHVLSVDEAGKITCAEGADVDELRNALAGEDLAEAGLPGEFMLGSVAATLLDESDLVQMFAHYADSLPEPVTLEDRARVAALANLFGLDEKFARGSFRKMASKGQVGHAKVARMMLAMLNKGTIKRAKKSTGGYMSGGYEKGMAYKGNVKQSAKMKIAKYKKANMQKQRMAARKAKVKVKEGIEDAPVYGFGEPLEGAVFEVAANSSARVPESSDKTATLNESTPMVGNRLVEGASLAASMLNLSKK